MSQYAFSFDIQRCIGCMACIVACQDQNSEYATDVKTFRHVFTNEEGKYPFTRIYHLSFACEHCGDAPCLRACPTKAIYKRREDGAILVDRNLCVGCYRCERACPFGAPAFLEDGKMAKCDLCSVRRDNGMKPACVTVCPVQALEVAPIDILRRKKAEGAAIAIFKSLLCANISERS